MKITVNHIYGYDVGKLKQRGWAVEPSKYDHMAETVGRALFKDFPSFGDAMREFEKVTGYDVIADTDQDGAPVYWFDNGKECVAGWQCGQYLYNNWRPTPRAMLELADKLEEDLQDKTLVLD